MPYVKVRLTNPKFILLNTEKQIVACESKAREVSFEWSQKFRPQSQKFQQHNEINSTL